MTGIEAKPAARGTKSETVAQGHFRRIRRVSSGGDARYDRLAANCLAFIQLASIRLWLRLNESAS
jgi:transposase